MLYSLQTEINDTDNVDFLTLFIGDGDDTIENLDDSGKEQDECLVGQHDWQQ